MKSVKRPPIAIIAAVALLCLVLVSAHFTSGMFARYTVNASSEGEARVASFDVSAEAMTESPVAIIANGTDENGKSEYTVTIKNHSETAVRFEAAVVFNDEDKAKFDDSDGKLTFSGDLAPNGEAEKTITLDMSAYFEENDKYSTFSNDDISGNQGQAPFEVLVTFTQID